MDFWTTILVWSLVLLIILVSYMAWKQHFKKKKGAEIDNAA